MTAYTYRSTAKILPCFENRVQSKPLLLPALGFFAVTTIYLTYLLFSQAPVATHGQVFAL